MVFNASRRRAEDAFSRENGFQQFLGSLFNMECSFCSPRREPFAPETSLVNRQSKRLGASLGAPRTVRPGQRTTPARLGTKCPTCLSSLDLPTPNGHRRSHLAAKRGELLPALSIIISIAHLRRRRFIPANLRPRRGLPEQTQQCRQTGSWRHQSPLCTIPFIASVISSGDSTTS
jgi:hypothetical protein